MACLAAWALAAGSAVHWGLQLGNPGQRAVQVAATEFSAQADARQIGQLLGLREGGVAQSAQVESARRYDLLGVVRHGARGGAAIISVDGRPARVYPVGRTVGDAGEHKQNPVRLVSVSERSAVLAAGQGGDTWTVQMPSLNTSRSADTQVRMPEGPSLAPPENEGQTTQSMALRQSAPPKPGVMRLATPESVRTLPASVRNHAGAAVSNASAYGVAP